MTDIVEKLRAPLGVMQCEVSCGPAPENKLERRWLLALEAADEIERLRAALREIASGKYSGIVLTSYPPQDPAVNAARAALKDAR